MMKDSEIPLITNPQKRILVVDDAFMNHGSADELLGKRYAIDHAYTFQEAISFLGYKDDWQYHEGHGKNYDYLLSDLNFPLVTVGKISPCTFTEEKLDPFPNGYPLVFIAARRGIPNIVVYTASDHHSDVSIGALDALLEKDPEKKYGFRRPIFNIENSRVAIVDHRVTDENWDWRNGKQWDKAIEYLQRDT